MRLDRQVHFLVLATVRRLAMVGPSRTSPDDRTEGAMTTNQLSAPTAQGVRDWTTLARQLGARFAARAATHDATDTFVADNYRELREHRMFSAGVPAELGGGGASHADL